MRRQSVLYCEGRFFCCNINTHFLTWTHHTHTSLRLPQYTMWNCALLLMARAVELIYYFWLLLLTWLKSKWLQPAGNVSTLKGTVSHIYSLSHSFIVFSIKSDSTVLWSVLKKIEFWACGIRISLCWEEKAYCRFPFLPLLLPFTHIRPLLHPSKCPSLNKMLSALNLS